MHCLLICVAVEGADFNAVLVNALDERAVVVDAYAATGANVGSVYGLELYVDASAGREQRVNPPY